MWRDIAGVALAGFWAKAKVLGLIVLGVLVAYWAYQFWSVTKDLAEAKLEFKTVQDANTKLKKDLAQSRVEAEESAKALSVLSLVASQRDKDLKQFEMMLTTFKQNLKTVRKTDEKASTWLDTPIPASVVRVLNDKTE